MKSLLRLCFSVFTLSAGTAFAAPPPNVLFISMDDLNDWIGCMGGHPQTKTPNLDRLATSGVLFNNAYCPAASCNPSRTAIFSGLPPHRSGLYQNTQKMREVLPEAELLPRYFSRHGYRSAGSGKMLHYVIDPQSWDDYFPDITKDNSFPSTFYPKQRPVSLPRAGDWQYVETDWAGKTGAGLHGDFNHEFDHIVGELMIDLETLGIADNTLVFISSDNGPEVTSVVHMRYDHAHDGAKPWRGMKRDAREGGHRVPPIIRRPDKVKSGSTSNQLVSLTDVMATAAVITGAELPREAAKDSFNLLPTLEGTATGLIRPCLLTQAFGGAGTLSIRRDNWKYIDHRRSRTDLDRGFRPVGTRVLQRRVPLPWLRQDLRAHGQGLRRDAPEFFRSMKIPCPFAVILPLAQVATHALI